MISTCVIDQWCTLGEVKEWSLAKSRWVEDVGRMGIGFVVHLKMGVEVCSLENWVLKYFLQSKFTNFIKDVILYVKAIEIRESQTF